MKERFLVMTRNAVDHMGKRAVGRVGSGRKGHQQPSSQMSCPASHGKHKGRVGREGGWGWSGRRGREGGVTVGRALGVGRVRPMVVKFKTHWQEGSGQNQEKRGRRGLFLSRLHCPFLSVLSVSPVLSVPSCPCPCPSLQP